MANNQFTITTPSGGVATTADANPHTILQALAPANQRVKVLSFEIGMHGTTVTNAPLRVRVLRQTTAGTGGSNQAPVNTNAVAEAIQTTGLAGPFSAEPTAGAVLWEGTVHPQLSTGKAMPISEEFIIPGGGRLAIEVLATDSNANVAYATLYCEE